MIHFNEIPKEKLEEFKELISSGERPTVAMLRLYESIGIKDIDQVALSTPVDILEWAIPGLDMVAVSGYIIDSGCPFFFDESQSREIDKIIKECTNI